MGLLAVLYILTASNWKQAVSTLLDVPLSLGYYILVTIPMRIAANPVVGLAMLAGNVAPIVAVIVGVHYFRKWRTRRAK